MKLTLVGIDLDLVEAWRREFREFDEVTIVHQDITQVATDTVVSPGNSHGWMNGGIDLVYKHFFGSEIESEVRRTIDILPGKILPVGAGVLVSTKHDKVPYLILAPTMEEPAEIPEDHAYRAMRAVLRTAARYPERVKQIFCPGLGTGIGNIPFAVAAANMATAYRDWKESLKP